MNEIVMPQLLRTYSIEGDSFDYELIEKGIELSKFTEGICCEIGLRRGMGTATIMRALVNNGIRKPVIAIDPYGNIPYEHKQDQITKLDYTNSMKNKAMVALYLLADELDINFTFFNLTDRDFFNLFWRGIPIYEEEEKFIDQYSFVHFDGPHSVGPLFAEINFFLGRIDAGACFCFDDVSTVDVYYDHDSIERYLLDHGFVLIDKTNRKALYQFKGIR